MVQSFSLTKENFWADLQSNFSSTCPKYHWLPVSGVKTQDAKIPFPMPISKAHCYWNLLWFFLILVLFLLSKNHLIPRPANFLSYYGRKIFAVCVLPHQVKTWSPSRPTSTSTMKQRTQTFNPWHLDPTSWQTLLLRTYLLSMHTTPPWWKRSSVSSADTLGEPGTSRCFWGYYTVTFPHFAERTY